VDRDLKELKACFERREGFLLSKVDWAKPSRVLITGLAGLTSFYNKLSKHFIKCNCLTKLQDFSRAEKYLFRDGSIRKRDQAMLCKELANARVSRANGYNL
jgi:hypothetical protein